MSLSKFEGLTTRLQRERTKYWGHLDHHVEFTSLLEDVVGFIISPLTQEKKRSTKPSSLCEFYRHFCVALSVYGGVKLAFLLIIIINLSFTNRYIEPEKFS